MAEEKCQEKCLIETCDNPAESRGLCNSCYREARRLVIDGETTWKILERTGKAKPLHRSKLRRALGLGPVERKKSKPSKRGKSKQSKGRGVHRT